MNKSAHKSKQKHSFISGFTLIELLVVITIIGILAVILIPNMVGMRQRARDSANKQAMGSLRDALRLYYNDFQKYPDTGTGNTMMGCGDGTGACSSGGEFSVNTVIYMKQLPENFLYEQTLDGDGFTAWIELENKSDGDIAATAAKCGKTVAAGETWYYVCEQ